MCNLAQAEGLNDVKNEPLMAASTDWPLIWTMLTASRQGLISEGSFRQHCTFIRENIRELCVSSCCALQRRTSLLYLDCARCFGYYVSAVFAPDSL